MLYADSKLLSSFCSRSWPEKYKVFHSPFPRNLLDVEDSGRCPFYRSRHDMYTKSGVGLRLAGPRVIFRELCEDEMTH